MIPRAQRIDLTQAASGMEARAAGWATGSGPRCVPAPAKVTEGKAICRCGAREPGEDLGLVPAWFGRDCIERACPLKSLPLKT